ncbi:MAG: 5-formyltetrahydrofolate cyclo-ligase [Clostridiaceae bacterium]|nr:5-formyltetrahydrofolate cyclo-ligase [Clostridiaceae bacterium]
MDKSQLRKEISQKRRMLDDDFVKNASHIIVETLKNLSELRTANIVLSYMPYGKEVDISPLNRWILDQGKILCLPRVVSPTEMEVRIVKDLENGLSKGSFGIWEPTAENELIDAARINLALVPGLAFDKSGNRMGHGAGYYDRFLSACSKSALFVGVAYRFQVFDSIPTDLYDVRVHKIVTEKHSIVLTGI